jgi:hypothetical protein
MYYWVQFGDVGAIVGTLTHGPTLVNVYPTISYVGTFKTTKTFECT